MYHSHGFYGYDQNLIPLGEIFFTTHPGPEVKKAAAAAAAENITMAEVNWCGIRAGAYGEKGMRRQMEDETLGVCLVP